jgi:hypothetical protein
MKRMFAFFASLALFLCFPVALAYAVEACNQPPAITASEIQLGSSLAESAAKAACKEIGADATNDIVAIACDVVGQSKPRPDSGKLSAETKPVTERRYFFVRRSEWLSLSEGGG